MRNYKGMYIIKPDLTEDNIKVVIGEISKIFTDNGSETVTVNEWGLKDMAYEIQKYRKGYYVVFTTSTTPAAVEEYNRIANIREDIIRHIIVVE
jgi:small subunit ribosomal protein S6